jgi:hypothetical protein
MFSTSLQLSNQDHEDTKQIGRRKEAMTAFDSFDTSRIAISSTHPPGKVELYVRTKGSGEGLLLLHGYPQTGRYVFFLLILVLLPVTP